MRVCCDIDGVLADVRYYVKKYLLHDWGGYFGCTLQFPTIPSMNELIQRFGEDEIYLVTGRPESNRWLTETWLTLKMPFPNPAWILRMRKDEDHRPGYQIKMEWYREIHPTLVIDDDPEVIEAASKEGFVVLQVHGYRITTIDMVPDTNYKRGE